MRYYFLGDLHGNEDALEHCLRHADDQRIDALYCLGDLVGWLPFGDRTLKRMRALNAPTVAGNHDLLAVGLFTDHPHQIDRMQATAYNAGLLSTMEGALEYLAGLPLAIEEDSFVMVHHSPFHLPPIGENPGIECFDYLTEEALQECLQQWADAPARLIVSGHDHIPAVYELRSGEEPPTMNDVVVHHPSERDHLTITLRAHSKYWVKAGSVGGPYRDDVPVANSVLYDSDMESLTLFRLPYPTEKIMQELTAHRFFYNLPTLRRYVALLRTFTES